MIALLRRFPPARRGRTRVANPCDPAFAILRGAKGQNDRCCRRIFVRSRGNSRRHWTCVIRAIGREWPWLCENAMAEV